MGIFVTTPKSKLSRDQIPPEQHSPLDTSKNFDDKLLDRSYVKNTFNNRTALNADRMSPVIQQLKNFPAGSTITTTFFSQTHNFTDKQSNIVDYSYLLNNVNRCYAKIMNLEIKLDGELTIEQDPDTLQTVCEGTGKIYPGLKTYAGDIFLYEIGPGQLGLFLIVDVNSLAIHTETHHTVSFVLKEIIDNASLAKLESCVIETYYFVRQELFGSSIGILKRSDYYAMAECFSLRHDMIKLYWELFYSNELSTIVRRDGIYDGYMVSFMNKLVSSKDISDYPLMQFLHEHDYKVSCIWTELLENKTVFNFTSINKCKVGFNSFYLLDGLINGLHNREYVHLDKEGELFYGGLTENFYNKNTALYTPFESLLAQYMATKVINLQELITQINGIGTLSDEGMFYQIPVFIFLCNKALSTF